MPRAYRLPAWLLLATVCALAAATPRASADGLSLDGARSRADFSVKVMWLVRVRGYFSAVRGAVDIDRVRDLAVVDARIEASAVRMNVRGYEDWVKSPEFFDAVRHPDIQFSSDAIPLQRLHSGGELPGQLTIRGIQRAVNFTLAAATCANPGRACAIVASGTIHRSRFGMRSRLGTLSDKVELRFSVFMGDPAPAS